MTPQQEQPPQTEPWDHPYESRDDSMTCIHCGWIGSYAHTADFYRKWVFPTSAATPSPRTAGSSDSEAWDDEHGHQSAMTPQQEQPPRVSTQRTIPGTNLPAVEQEQPPRTDTVIADFGPHIRMVGNTAEPDPQRPNYARQTQWCRRCVQSNAEGIDPRWPCEEAQLAATTPSPDALREAQDELLRAAEVVSTRISSDPDYRGPYRETSALEDAIASVRAALAATPSPSSEAAITVNGHHYVHVAACPCPAMQAEMARLASAPEEGEGE